MGMVKVPVAITLAIALPEIMPNRPLEIRATLPSPPVEFPTSLWPILTKVSAPPVSLSMAPKMPNIASIVAEIPAIVLQIPMEP